VPELKISFDLNTYKNTYDGEVTASDITPQRNNPDAQVWAITVAELTSEDGVNWERTQQAQPCVICGETYRHRHDWHYPSNSPMSSTARFLLSCRDNGNITVTGPKDILGKRYRFEEIIDKGGTNRKTGEQYKDQRHQMVHGPIGQSDAQPDETAPETPPANVTSITAPVTAATANGVATSDLYGMLAELSDGKTLDEVKLAARSTPALFDNKAFYITILNGSAFTELENRQLAVKDENQVFRKV